MSTARKQKEPPRKAAFLITTIENQRRRRSAPAPRQTKSDQSPVWQAQGSIQGESRPDPYSPTKCVEREIPAGSTVDYQRESVPPHQAHRPRSRRSGPRRWCHRNCERGQRRTFEAEIEVGRVSIRLDHSKQEAEVGRTTRTRPAATFHERVTVESTPEPFETLKRPPCTEATAVLKMVSPVIFDISRVRP